ncbi:MAG: hypothetical protein QG656_235, partial [Candidatus Hydrogenedentes bacterium]|nr:hypothetical protein [Candidatus Hydrogenedentota bacterium]
MKTTIGILAPRMTEEESRSISLDFVLRLKKTHRQLTLNCLHDLLRDPEAAAVPPGYSYEEHSIPAAAFYLTGLLRAHGYDTVMDYRWDTAALERMAKASPRAVCVSTTMLLHRRSLENVVASIRTFMPDALIVVGGILVWKSYTWLETISAHPEIAAGMPEDEVGRWAVFPCWRPELDADVIVAAPHGGPTLIRILDEIEKGNRAGLEDIPNLALPGTSGEFHFTARADEGIDHDTNFTRWDLLDALPVRVPVTTSVGCPHRCGFCDFCRMYPKLVFRSRQSLLAEFTMIRDLLPRNPGTFLLQFTDDNAFANAPRIEEVCHALLDSKLELFWASLMRVSSITEANVDLVKRSGLVLAMTGVESGDPGQLKRMNKALNLDKLRAGIELLDRNHIPVAMSLVMGYPGE